MNLETDSREWQATAMALLAALVAGGAMLLLASLESPKPLLGATGVALSLTLAYLSGNLRLFCLWAVAITIPFKLGKQFGPAIYKGGGETAFRIEMYDPFLLALAAILVWELWTNRRPGLRIPRITWIWLLIMTVWGGAAILLGPYRLTAAHEISRMLKITLLFVVLVNELRTRSGLHHFVAALTLGMVIQASIGLLQYVTGQTLGLEVLGEVPEQISASMAASSVRGQDVFRVSAFLLHPNVFGIYLAAILLLPIALLVWRVGWCYRMYLLLVVMLGMGAMIVTLSRSSWVSFASAFVLFMCLMISHSGLRRRSLVMLGAGTLALVLATAPLAGKIVSRVFESRPEAMLGRAELERDARGMIAVKPWLGWGLNSYSCVAPSFSRHGPEGARRIYGPWLPPVHHIYYLWWAETGVVGLALHLAIWGGVVWTAIGNLRARDELLFAVNAACLCAMLAFAIDGFFSFTLRVNAALRVFWALAAIVIAIHYWRLTYPRGEPTEGVGRPVPPMPGA